MSSRLSRSNSKSIDTYKIVFLTEIYLKQLILLKITYLAGKSPNFAKPPPNSIYVHDASTPPPHRTF